MTSGPDGPVPALGRRARAARAGLWPVDPDPAVTNLAGRQGWRFADDRALAVEVAGRTIPTDDARIAHLGIRRNAAGRPYPACFSHCPESGARLGPVFPAADPEILDPDPGAPAVIALSGGVPAVFRAGRPQGLYVLQTNLGVLEAWDGRAFAPMGRLPPVGAGASAQTGPEGLAYAAADALVVVPLPQIGAGLAHHEVRAPGLAFASDPAWTGRDVVALGRREGRMVLCRWTRGALAERDLGRPCADGERLGGPWANRLGDVVWTAADGFFACRSGGGEARFAPWPEGFRAVPGLAPWRDRADVHHQVGTWGDGYATAALEPGGALHRLDGPHCAAGGVTYSGSERFDLPWQEPVEALNLGAHAGDLLLPLLAMARDTVLVALDIPGPRAGFLRGAELPAPVTGHVLHHAHGVGLRRLPASLEVSRLADPGALLHDGALYLWSRGEGRCHALRLRA